MMTKIRARLTACICAAGGLFLLTASLPAQEPDANPVISVDVRRVVLYVTVREGNTRFVGDLTKNDFAIKEDGAPQEILAFRRDDVPAAIGLLVDNSQSMMNKYTQVLAAAKVFIDASNPGDEMFILHFNEKVTFGLPPDVPFSSDHIELGKALDRMQQT